VKAAHFGGFSDDEANDDDGVGPPVVFNWFIHLYYARY
jgi:hypothetical protein